MVLLSVLCFVGPRNDFCLTMFGFAGVWFPQRFLTKNVFFPEASGAGFPLSFPLRGGDGGGEAPQRQTFLGGGVGGPTAERPISRSFSNVFADAVAGRIFNGFGIGFGPVWHNCLARFDTFSRLELRCEIRIDLSMILDPPHVAKSQEYVIPSAKK